MRVLRVYNWKIGVSHRKILIPGGERIYFYRTPPYFGYTHPQHPQMANTSKIQRVPLEGDGGTRRADLFFFFFLPGSHTRPAIFSEAPEPPSSTSETPGREGEGH